MTFSMQIAVVDQVQFEGAGTPRLIVLDDAARARAEQLGRNVAAQIGRGFDDAEYLGDEPGVCPMCHLDVVVLRGTEIECASCGARGRLVVAGGDVTVAFDDEGRKRSVISMHEKREQLFEIQDTARRHAGQRDEIERRARELAAYDRRVAPERETA